MALFGIHACVDKINTGFVTFKFFLVFVLGVNVPWELNSPGYRINGFYSVSKLDEAQYQRIQQKTFTAWLSWILNMTVLKFPRHYSIFHI